MRVSSLAALAFVPPIAAILIQAPEEIQAGQRYNLSWAPDPEMLVLYLTEDREPPLYPIAVASTADEGTTVRFPNVKFDAGYIVAYGRDGKGPIGGTGRIPISQA